MPPYLNRTVTHQKRASFSGKVLKSSLFAAAAGCLVLISGCGKEEPTYYEVQEVESTPATQPVQPAMPVAQPAEAAQPGFSFAIPDGWSQKVASTMVIMALQAGSPPEEVADLAVSAFPGDVGGQLANVNRWRRQVGLGPIEPSALAGFITPVGISGMEGWQVDLTGPAGADGVAVRMIVSAVAHNGQTWFFKLTGSQNAVEAQKDNYGNFLNSVKF